MDVKILVTGNLNTDFKELITLLDEDLTERNGEIQKFFNPLNNTDHIQAAVVLYHEDIPVACGAYKIYNDTSVEMKRIYVKKDQRRNGFAKQVLNKLEELAKSDGYSYAILETG
ncbi:MAG TPA: GNAT family N-acetyltransferase, partial [Mobilitalea sp.]|nr:GNAT family N-acetyltransferase [Mobilitalea sp.]